MINFDDQELWMEERSGDTDFTLDIEDYSGRNFDTDVLDTIVEASHTETPSRADVSTDVSSDDILDEDHWASDSFEELHVDREY